ncbi:hypothetical protein [Mucilaginibacter pocheonensis]|uniref:Helix-turn-helix domain-containing protein n=1 Tax=Mucilaginibacter pocheonensis TaxID=398050 RepID=A0ABU1T7H4_9SPHI|nr:hypothetical protein [Mucilaginibacter pocheonensis]MDR6941352.1 hypothetical protein [Mucilaginibacter pocheonensis]
MKLAQQADRFLQKASDDKRLLPSHISLFMAMFYYSPDKPGDHFQVSRKKLMRFSRIKSVATYHKCIRELVAYGYIDYQPSYDPYRASSVALLN